MTLALPEPLGRYYAAQNAHDTEALLACFSTDAKVRDEGADIVGHEAIRAWKERTSAKYRVTAEPLTCEKDGRDVTVTARVSGTFPGSPAVLTYHFGLSPDGLVTTLMIG